MSMMMSHILKFVDFTKTQKSRERNIFSSNKKINKLHITGYFMTKNTFVAEVTFNNILEQDQRQIKTCK